MEAFGNQRIEMPLAEDGKLTVPLSSLYDFAKHANVKLRQSHQLITKLETNVKLLAKKIAPR
jgi:tRNA(Phe) wybutosine-synthesizing methylase Tyw3